MKKVLFLSFPYPYAKFGPSTNCSLRIMKCLVNSGRYEVHCCSYIGVDGKKNYEDVPQIVLHQIPIVDPRRKESSRLMVRIKRLLKLPIYPFRFLISDYHHYRVCREVLRKNQFDVVVSQCYSEQSLMTGVLLKKHGIAQKLMVIFWDDIYGMIPQKIIPKGFALRRQRKAESWIAKYADLLISLYPIKAFHEQYGDVPNAKGKRIYLGVPSLMPPQKVGESSYKHVIRNGKINILYSGTVYNMNHVEYFVRLLNKLENVSNINLILFSRGLSNDKASELKQMFHGSIQLSGWIPLNDLFALFPIVDCFVSFPGNPTSICSKVFEYMSYGKPVIVFYESDNDVNSKVFSKYSESLTVDLRKKISDNVTIVDDFMSKKHNPVPFEITENLFKIDTPKIYLDKFDELLY